MCILHLASLPVPFLLSLLSPLLPLSPQLSPNLILRDGLANSRLLVGHETPPFLLAAPAATITRLFRLPVCVLHIHTQIHVALPTAWWHASWHIFLPHPYLPNLIILFDLLLLFFSLSCVRFFPHTHTTLHVHGAVQACPYHAHIYVLFFFCTHVYTRFYPARCRLFTHINIFTYLNLFIHIYICISTHAHDLTRAFEE